jgi:hypothetical protein
MRNLQITSITFIFVLLLSGCIKDNFDAPDTACLDQGADITNIIDIATLKAGYNNQSIEIDAYVKATVTLSDRSGNLFKEFYVQDATGSLAISVDITNAYTKYPVGRTIYINVNGLYLANGDLGYGVDGSFVTRIPALFIDDFIIRGSCGEPIVPLEVEMSQLNGVEVGTLVKITGVEFQEGLDGVTYANAVTLQSENRLVADCFGNSVIVRNSGFSDFASELLPTGNGSIVGVYSPFGNTPQLLIGGPENVDMTAVRCDGSNPNQNIVLSKNFEDGSISSGGWSVQTPIGSFNWVSGTQGSGQQGTTYAKASNFAGGNTTSETWLISPAIDVSSEVNPVFKFQNAYNFTGTPLECLISTDYDGLSEPSSATWNSLNPVLSSGGWAWVSSGSIDLSLYQTGAFYIGFRYRGSNSDGSTWEIDAIQIIAD